MKFHSYRMPKNISIISTASEMVLILSLLVSNPLPKYHFRVFFLQPSLQVTFLRKHTLRWISIYKKVWIIFWWEHFFSQITLLRELEKQDWIQEGFKLPCTCNEGFSQSSEFWCWDGLQSCSKMRQGDQALGMGCSPKGECNTGWSGSLQMRPDPGRWLSCK